MDLIKQELNLYQNSDILRNSIQSDIELNKDLLDIDNFSIKQDLTGDPLEKNKFS